MNKIEKTFRLAWGRKASSAVPPRFAPFEAGRTSRTDIRLGCNGLSRTGLLLAEGEFLRRSCRTTSVRTICGGSHLLLLLCQTLPNLLLPAARLSSCDL